MFTVASTTQTDAVQEYRLPASVSGKNVYIRVRDSNRTPPSWKATDTVYIDAMSITHRPSRGRGWGPGRRAGAIEKRDRP